MSIETSDTNPALLLLNTFRTIYRQFELKVQEVLSHRTDSVVLERLGDDLTEFARLSEQYGAVFPTEEYGLIQENIGAMLHDIQLEYRNVLDTSHHGRPTVLEVIQSGQRGRPTIQIDPDFLRWAYSMRSVSGIARFLGCSRTTVRNQLLEYGIVEPQLDPFYREEPVASSEAVEDELLDPLSNTDQPVSNSTLPSYNNGRVSNISDEELDDLISHLRINFRRAGITMLDGMLRRLGYIVPRERIRLALIRIDPVHRVFQRIRIRRRKYSVPGPNALWHHDGQHGLIRWGIIIHGFIDGYSRLITALRASNNNRSITVLDLFLAGAALYGVPSRVRGDHGVENLLVAAWMELVHGYERGSYIWGRSIHNVRIERLWVDVTAQVGATWADHFTTLEVNHGLDINNPNHLWLLHHLFLPLLNAQLEFFAESWNQHRMQIRDGPNRSPADMFTFDMLVHGVRGSQLPDDESLSDEELEVFGVDWEGLQDETVLAAYHSNNSSPDGTGSWIRQRGPPEHLNEVPVDPPEAVLDPDQVSNFDFQLLGSLGEGSDLEIVETWTRALILAKMTYPTLF